MADWKSREAGRIVVVRLPDPEGASEHEAVFSYPGCPGVLDFESTETGERSEVSLWFALTQGKSHQLFCDRLVKAFDVADVEALAGLPCYALRSVPYRSEIVGIETLIGTRVTVEGCVRTHRGWETFSVLEATRKSLLHQHEAALDRYNKAYAEINEIKHKQATLSERGVAWEDVLSV